MLTKEQQLIADEIKKLLDLLPIISNIEREFDQKQTDLQFMANTTFITRKCEDILDSIKKRLKELESKIAQQACLVFAQMGEHKYSTEYCTVSPNASFYIKYPSSPDKEGYEEFVKQLPITCIRPHYPSIGKAIVEAIEAGAEIPYGLNKEEIKGTEFKLRLTGKREV